VLLLNSDTEPEPTALGPVYEAFAKNPDLGIAGAALRDPDGAPLYPPVDRNRSSDERQRLITAGARFALRLDMARATAEVGAITWHELSDRLDAGVEITADPSAWGDVVLAGRDTDASYNLAVVIDDAAQGVTHVVRGRDLYAATAVHRLLQILLGLAEPLYHHHRLIQDENGKKLSKSTDATGLAALRNAGLKRADIRQLVGLPPD